MHPTPDHRHAVEQLKLGGWQLRRRFFRRVRFCVRLL
jgi:hypothetical protein